MPRTSTCCLGFVLGGKVHVSRARSIFSNALNFRCSVIAALPRSPWRYCPFRSQGGPPLPPAAARLGSMLDVPLHPVLFGQRLVADRVVHARVRALIAIDPEA